MTRQRITLLPAIAIALAFAVSNASAAMILTEGFETDGGQDGAGRYTTDNEFYADGENLFIETSDTDTGSVSNSLGTPVGSHYFVAEDLDEGNPDVPTLSDPAKITFSGLGPVTGGTLTVALAAENGGWEPSGSTLGPDLFQIVADVDGDGTFEVTLQGTDITGGNIEVKDTALTTTFTDFSFTIPDATSASDDLAIGFRILNGGSEALGIDDVRVTGELIPEPATLALLGLGGAVMLSGRRRRA